MKLAFSIATRFLKSNKAQTILILLGITIGVAVQIFIGSLIDGLQISLVDKTIGSSSHITIVPSGKEKYFQDTDGLYSMIKSDERFTAVSKSLDSSAFVIKDEESYPILIRGFEFQDANNIYKFDENMVEGSLPSKSNEIIIGKNLAEDLAYKPGDNIEVLIPGGTIEELNISGIYDLKVASINNTWAPTSISTSEDLFDKKGELSQIETQIENVYDADLIAGEYIDNSIGDNVKVNNWKDQNEELLSALTGQSASSYMIQVFVLLAVLLGIASVLAISVVQKSRQIGILKAMGINDKTSSLIFLSQGLVLGFIGSIIGALTGLGLSYVFSVFVKNPDGSPLVPFYFDLKFIIGSIAIAIVSSTIASLIPAINSSKLNPIEVIKNG